MLAISNGAATAVRTVNGCIRTSRHPAHVSEPPSNRSGGDHCGTHDVGQCTTALAAFVISVSGRGAALAGRDQFAVRAVAHRASRIPPLEPGIDENAIEPLGFSL